MGISPAVRYASREIEAISDLWMTAAGKFATHFASIPTEALQHRLESEDADCETPLAVGAHVTRAGLCHVTWALELAGLPGPDPARPTLAAVRALRIPFRTRDEVIGEMERLLRIVPPALAPMTNEHLSKIGTSWWGEPFSSEGMLEHAVMHFYRHRRQLGVRFGLGDPQLAIA